MDVGSGTVYEHVPIPAVSPSPRCQPRKSLPSTSLSLPVIDIIVDTGVRLKENYRKDEVYLKSIPRTRTSEYIAMKDIIYNLAAPSSRPPAPWTYWVVEDSLLAGSFPTTSSPEESLRRIQVLLDAGIMTWFDFTEEWELVRFGESLLPYPALVERLGMGEEVKCLRRAFLDMSVPERALLDTILDEIDHSLTEDRPVYVHCWGGMGRTGTVIGCWLIRHGLATRDNVLDLLQQLRLQDKVHGLFDSPQTPEQRQFVQDFVSTRHS